jgi:hypothetical protein
MKNEQYIYIKINETIFNLQILYLYQFRRKVQKKKKSYIICTKFTVCELRFFSILQEMDKIVEMVVKDPHFFINTELGQTFARSTVCIFLAVESRKF